MAFFEALMQHQPNEFLVVVLRDYRLTTLLAKFYLLSIAEYGSEAMIDCVSERVVIELFSMLAQVLDNLPAVSVNALQIIFRKFFINQLLPEDWCQVEWHA